MRDIATANVEQPADRVRQRQNDSVLAIALQAGLDFGDLIGGRTSCQRERLHYDRIGGRLRASFAPQNVDRVFGERLQFYFLFRNAGSQPGDFTRRIVPRIEADRLALAEGVEQPFLQVRTGEK